MSTEVRAEIEHRMEMSVGQRVRLAPDGRRWWTVQAVSEHFVACVQQVPFQPKGTFRYTVLDWRNGVRGPCNLIGQGWGDGFYSEQECAEMLDAFEARDAEREYDLAMMAEGRTSWPAYKPMPVEISHRNRVPLSILACYSEMPQVSP